MKRKDVKRECVTREYVKHECVKREEADDTG